jgi:hypothetical protein
VPSRQVAVRVSWLRADASAGSITLTVTLESWFGGCMPDRDESVEALIRAAQVGDTVRIRMDKGQLNAEVRDRVSPIMEPLAAADGRTRFRGIEKDAAGLWDLEQTTGAKASGIVEVVIRRAASDL